MSNSNDSNSNCKISELDAISSSQSSTPTTTEETYSNQDNRISLNLKETNYREQHNNELQNNCDRTNVESIKNNNINTNNNNNNINNIKCNTNKNTTNLIKNNSNDKLKITKSNGTLPTKATATLQLQNDNIKEQKSPIKSILTVGNGDLSSTTSLTTGNNNNNSNTIRKSIKKSVTFDPDSEIVKKFIEGEVIVDKRNPFKNGTTVQNGTDLITSSNKKNVTKLRSTNNNNNSNSHGYSKRQQKLLDDTEYITKEEVLKESKYVKTYIKNPDKFFIYDPTIIAKIKFEELRELKNKKPPRKIRLTSQTQERLKDIKKQSKLSSSLSSDIIHNNTNSNKSKIPSYRKVTKSNYPDLSDIKVKVGTDIEESFFNPEEVTINAKKFDECVKKLQISSDDDLDEIDTALTKSDSSDELKTNKNDVQCIDNNKDEKKSFTNTVNSKEFQEYLDKKGLLLTPKKTMLNGDINKKQQQNNLQQKVNGKKCTMSNSTLNNMNVINNNSTTSTTTTTVMEPKKVKKPSMFQRLLPSSIFSSKRKTTPKETVPISHNVYTTSTSSTINADSIANSNLNNDSKLLKTTSSPIKRIVLERQSFHGGSTNSNSNSANDLRKCIERSRKSYGGDDRSSSISSALTNAEEFMTGTPTSTTATITSASVTTNDRQSIDSKLVMTDGNESKKSSKEQLNAKPIKATKIKKTSSRERLQNLHSKSTVDGRDVIIKPRAQKLQSNIGNVTKSLPNKVAQKVEKNDLRKSAEKQVQPKRSTSFEDGNISKRSSSLGRHESSKRQNSLPKISSSQREKSSARTENVGVLETSLDNGPKMTSTPLRSNEKPKQVETKVVTIPPPNEYSTSPQSITTTTTFKAFDIGPEEWVKLQEIKEITDRELFNRITPVQVIDKTSIGENIYEKLPIGRNIEQQPSSLPYRPDSSQFNPEANFIRGSPQRNTFAGVSSNRHVKVIDGNSFIMPQIMNKAINDHSKSKLEPPRSQSVMDEMITGHQQQPVYGSIAGTPVIMRRKGGRVLSREEILNKVKEFCRKSMNRTPTNSTGNQTIKEENKVSSNISPVSYASVDFHNRVVGKTVAPQVPQRIQSLQAPVATHQIPLQASSPVYAHVLKRSSIQSNASDIYDSPQRRATIVSGGGELHSINLRPRASTISDTDSVFLPVNRPSSSSPSGRYVIVEGATNSTAITPSVHTIKYQNEAIYRQTTMPSPYGYIQLKPQQMHQTRTTDAASMNGLMTVSSSSGVSSPTYRGSPNVLQHSPRYHSTQQLLEHQHQQQQFHQQHAQQTQRQQAQQQQQKLLYQQQQGQRPVSSVVYLKVKDQVYTPITNSFASGKNIIPAASSSSTSSTSASVATITTGKNTSSSSYSSNRKLSHMLPPYESESGSEAGEVQRILQNRRFEEDWQNDKSGRSQSNEQASDDRRRAARREDPRRHTLGGDMLQYGSGQGQMQQQQQQRAMDLEMGTRAQKSKKAPPIRGYTPINQGPLFDEDPGIMSEVETASTGFRRGGKQRSSLPVVRTPSKTLERPLGLVFLQYRSETKRALLPNEITSIDTVRALFVRSFPRQLTMAYLEGPNVKIYIHDASKDMFYELEDVRSHLREIRDRSVLRLFESNEVAAPQVLPGGPGVPQPLPPTGSGHWDQEQSYFSEPEFDSEYQHQHIHKSKGSSKPAPYYVGATQQTLPRGMYSDRNKNTVGAPVKPLRSYGSRGNMGPAFPYTPDQLYSIPDGYTSSPERGTRSGYEEPYYSQYGTRGTTVTPIIDEEQRCDATLSEDQYALYGMKVTGRIPRAPNQLYDPTRPEDLHRIRVEHMERQLANLTGLVQKALNQNPQMAAQVGALNANYLTIPGQCRTGLEDLDGHSSGSSTSIQDKSVSFEKSVSFSDDIQGVPKSHSPQHTADTKPPKPAIKSSTLPRTSSQERDRLKPPPPPKPLTLASGHPNYRPDIALAPEVYNHLRGLQKKAKDLRMEVRTLRRLSQAQAIAVREDIKDAFMRIRATLLASSGTYWGQGDQEKTRISREEELYKQEVIRLEKDLTDLESSVEGLRGEVINRRTRVNMAAVEDMALVLSRASKTVAELKMRFPGLQQGLRNILANEMEKVVREEKFLKDEPDRLESALRRCKKLTGTLVTLKRLASVQEQRLPVVEPTPTSVTAEEPPRSAELSSGNKPVPSPRLGSITISGGVPPENALDALLDELQTFAKPQSQSSSLDPRPDDSTSDDSSQTLQNTITTQISQENMFPMTNLINDPNAPLQCNINLTPNATNGFNQTNMNSLRRLHSYPSGSDTDTSPPQPTRPAAGKPPVPERNADLLSKVSNKRIPPPPPPRTSSRSPLASPTSPNVPQRLPSVNESDQIGNGNGNGQDGSGNSSGNESGNDHVQRQLALEMRHQELLKKQKMLQEQYARLQAMSKNSIALPPSDILQLKKTGSESNLPQKMGLSLTVTGSMKNLNAELNVTEKNEKNLINSTKTIGIGEESTTISSSSSSAPAQASTISNTNATNINNAAGTATNTNTTGATTTNKVYETDIL